MNAEGIAEAQRKFFGTLLQHLLFFLVYMPISMPLILKKRKQYPLDQRTELDRWILSELHSLIQAVDTAYEDYEPTKASRAISDFVQEKIKQLVCTPLSQTFLERRIWNRQNCCLPNAI